MERRQYERHGLRAPLVFSWLGPKGVRHRRRGLLRNISGGGVFVCSSESPPVDARIRLSVPVESFFVPGSEVIIRAAARVVRWELLAPDEGSSGFAAAIDTFTLYSGDQTNRQRARLGKLESSR